MYEKMWDLMKCFKALYYSRELGHATSSINITFRLQIIREEKYIIKVIHTSICPKARKAFTHPFSFKMRS